MKMRRRTLRIACLALIVTAATACGSGAPSSTPVPAATSFDGYAVGFCAAFQALFRAVGNPDTGEGSVLSKALDDAVTAGDGGVAEQRAGEITAELETGRRHVAYARGWAPAAPMLDQLDRVFVAFEAMTAAKAAKAKGEPGAIDPQAALEQAGGIEAWFAMLTARPTLEEARPDGVQPCADVPISP